MGRQIKKVTIAGELKDAAQTLGNACRAITFTAPVAYVYNPLEYAWESHSLYLEQYGNSRKRVIFLGMNPGPWGMVQTGVPFGEVDMVKQWLGIHTPVSQPAMVHPKRPVLGFDCPRSEVSGRRLWQLFRQRFGSPSFFSRDHFVGNYCPLAFLEESGKNRTPDKLKPQEREQLFEICDEHLKQMLEILQPVWVIGVGQFAGQCIARVVDDLNLGSRVKTASILHPSPASPAANMDWAGTVTRQLEELGTWSS